MREPAGNLGLGLEDQAQVRGWDAQKDALGRDGDGGEIRFVLHDLTVTESVARSVDGGDQMAARVHVAGFAPAADD